MIHADYIRILAATSDGDPRIVDEVSTGLTYIGYSTPDALTSEYKWNIKRITISGTQTIIDYANKSKSFDKSWDERDHYFDDIPAVPTFYNTLYSQNTAFFFSFYAIYNAADYYYDIATDSGFTNILDNCKNIKVTWWYDPLKNTKVIEIPGLIKGTTYYVRMKATNIKGESAYNTAISFTMP